MTVLYRAVWSASIKDNAEQTLENARHAISAWARESQDPKPFEEGATEFSASQGRARRVVHRSVSPTAFEVTVDDQVASSSTEWTTILRLLVRDDVLHVLVENRMNSDDFNLRVSVGRPRIVHDLLAGADHPRLGGSGVLTEPVDVPADGIAVLTELLGNSQRALPVIVCTEPPGVQDQEWIARASRIASRAEGIATVVTLEQRAAASFRTAFRDLAIWGGGIRVYGPGEINADSDGWRHRYYLRSRIEQAAQSTIDRIVYSVAQLSARRRVPDAFREFDVQGVASGDSELATAETTELERERERWEFEYDLALEERSELEKELSRANGHLARLKDELSSRGLSDLLWGTQHEVGTAIPDLVQDTSEAVLAAQTYLTAWLALPDSAPRELADIDTAPTAFAWGNNAWRGLRALSAYAEDRAGGWDKGGFWEWCASGPLLGWPATTKKLSMSEGETVQNSDKLRRTRLFKVDSEVAESGEILMLAHLKISEGGGNLAPRIYFYDDTGGKTRKVHVGLVGPHYLVPNRSTN